MSFKRLLRWLGIGLAGLVVLVLLVTMAVYGLSTPILRKTYAVPLVEVVVPSGPAAVTEGQRLASVRGCIGCHGAKLEGDVFIDEPVLARFVSPNLSRLAPTYTNAELEGVIRHGVKKSGRSVLLMPSSMFAHLSDTEVGLIIAFVRSVPPVDNDLPVTTIGPMGRFGLVVGMFHTEAAVINHAAPHAAVPPKADRLSYGKYLALTSCTECHGPDLKGQAGGGPPAPNLAMASAYSDSAFRSFMRTGNALGNRRLSVMSEVAEVRFSYFSADEVSALHAYLKTLPGTP